MAHAVESMMFYGETPWHGLGKVIDDATRYDVIAAIKAAGLDWQVTKEQLQTMDGQIVPDAFCTRRSTDKTVLGTVGAQYTILQNHDAFSWFQPFLDTRQVSFETAGSLHGGEVIWVLAKIAENIQVTYGDEVAKYLLLAHSHSGRLKVQASATPIRVVCQNTLKLSNGDKKTKFFLKTRHTKNMESRLNDAREEIAKANHLFLLEAEKYRFLASKPITYAQQLDYFKKVLEIKDSERLDTRSKNRLERMVELAETGMGANLLSAKGTWWGSYNAFTQHQSWEAGRTQENRLDNLWFKADDALDIALEMASA